MSVFDTKGWLVSLRCTAQRPDIASKLAVSKMAPVIDREESELCNDVGAYLCIMMGAGLRGRQALDMCTKDTAVCGVSRPTM